MNIARDKVMPVSKFFAYMGDLDSKLRVVYGGMKFDS